MVYMPHEDTGNLRKLALPYHGPYWLAVSSLMMEEEDEIDDVIEVSEPDYTEKIHKIRSEVWTEKYLSRM